MRTDYRKTCFESHGRQCQHCGGEENIEVHHLDGDRNNNSADNLIPLCRNCHRKLHRSGLDGLEDKLKPIGERSHLDPTVTTFGFTASRKLWQEWKSTVPRDKSLETRIIELIEADTEGRVQEADDE